MLISTTLKTTGGIASPLHVLLLRSAVIYTQEPSSTLHLLRYAPSSPICTFFADLLVSADPVLYIETIYATLGNCDR
ncbi:hypothetical protein L2E82_44665 [Cichorium intybus]|uniref:Uncharacterized protein n=1 Tax=Cichorium intybus TaxID=13427 RepID=A0ACB8ZRS0_CICIN|nr:hypothetical protein L2E82_44665 [Cichorium intybus]